MENEIRKSIPITYLNIWDDYPAPLYNKPYYEACDLLMGISKQTVNINKLVLDDKADSRIVKYVPHGLNHELVSPIDENHEKWNELQEFKKHYLVEKNMILFYFLTQEISVVNKFQIQC